MIINKLKPCCYDCDTPCIEVNEREAWNFEGTKVFTTIYCDHQTVCKYYLENESEDNKNE